MKLNHKSLSNALWQTLFNSFEENKAKYSLPYSGNDVMAYVKVTLQLITFENTLMNMIKDFDPEYDLTGVYKVQ
ncbi:MAG: hypothetical protein HC866_03070 [Leptolyngbyaceae cyanobacterium RU_5_1]|nr:hypothetical protein [Leptolyngbyaceae cyanobacterium RU_5_1]